MTGRAITFNLPCGTSASAERQLLARPERLKVLVVIHDGQPVYHGSRGDDWELSRHHLRQLETHGLTPIGVYLGHSADDERKLSQLFRWLVVCNGEQLPDKLGDLLRCLASTT
jgi:nitric oxide reductase activation protein